MAYLVGCNIDAVPLVDQIRLSGDTRKVFVATQVQPAIRRSNRRIGIFSLGIVCLVGASCGGRPPETGRAEPEPTVEPTAAITTLTIQNERSAPTFGRPREAQDWLNERFFQESDVRSVPINPSWLSSDEPDDGNGSEFFVLATSYAMIRTLCAVEGQGLVGDVADVNSTHARISMDSIEEYRNESWFPTNREGDALVDKEVPTELSEYKDYLNAQIDIYIDDGYSIRRAGTNSVWTYFYITAYFNSRGQVFETEHDMDRLLADYMRTALEAGMDESIGSNPLQSCDQSK